jgi:hypothetical protein
MHSLRMSLSENRFPLFHSALKTRVNALMDMRYLNRLPTLISDAGGGRASRHAPSR